jgi:hypothetical protein
VGAKFEDKLHLKVRKENNNNKTKFNATGVENARASTSHEPSGGP